MKKEKTLYEQQEQFLKDKYKMFHKELRIEEKTRLKELQKAHTERGLPLHD